MRPALLAGILGASGGWAPVSAPAGFTAPRGIGVERHTGTGAFRSDFVAAPPLVEGGPGVSTYYVDKATGVDTNAGTAGAPFRTIAKAMQVSRATAPQMLLKVKGSGNVYYEGENFSTRPQSLTLAVQSWDGAPIVSSNELQLSVGAWSLESGNTYGIGLSAYTYSRLSSHVWDGKTPNAWGDHVPLKPVANLAAVQSTPGTYWLNTSTYVLYVHTADSRAPDADIHVYDGWSTPGYFADFPGSPAATVLYLEDVQFFGGAAPVALTQTSTTLATVSTFNRCVFKYASANYVLNTSGNFDQVLIDCVGGNGHGDIVSYNQYGSGPPPRGVEISCVFRSAGILRNGSLANQCTTAHTGSQVLRVNGAYYGAESDQVADVQAGTQSWNLGCIAGPGGPVTPFAAFRAGNGVGAAKMWLDGCTNIGMVHNVASDVGCTVYTRDLTGSGTNTGAGAVTAY